MEYNETIARIIGQDLIKQQILDSMQNEKFSVFEIIGIEGCGKKTLSNHISDIWIKQYGGMVYTLNATYYKITEDYSSFKTLIIQNKKTKNLLLNIFCEAAKEIPYIGSSISTIVSELIKYNTSAETSNEYVDREHFIISEIHKHAKNKPMLFICNDFDMWDLKSQQTLSALIKYESNNIYNKSFFILNTTHILESFPDNYLQKRYLEMVSSADLQEIISQFNSQIQLSGEQTTRLFELTKGNLELIKEVWPPIIKYAENAGVKIGIENCPMLFTEDEWPGGQNIMSTPAVWRKVFEVIDSPNFGLNYDPSHFVWQQIDYIKPIYEFQDKIFHVHYKDIKVYQDKLKDVGVMATPLQYMSPKLPGLGDVDWAKYVSALTDIGYEGYTCIEVEDKSFEKDIEAAKKAVILSQRYLKNYVI